MKRFGVGLMFTEMVSDMGLIYGNKETETYLDIDEDELPVGIQLFGHDPENIAKAADITSKLAQNFSLFDINAGCPVNKVTKTGAGSALLKNPEILAEMVRKIKAQTGLPVTAKIRLGWDNSHINFLETITLLVDSGVDAISIHARTMKELYSGKPHFELLENIQEKFDVPIIVSGNIFTLDDAINALEITKATAVMVARGSIGNPFLIKQIDHYLETGERLPNPSLAEQKKYCLELAKYLIEEKGEERAMTIYRSMAPRFFTGFPNSKEIRSLLAQNLCSYRYLEEVLNSYNPEIE